MLIQTESKAQGWRAVAVFDDRPDALIFVGRSSTQVRQEYVGCVTSNFRRGRTRTRHNDSAPAMERRPRRGPLGAQEHLKVPAPVAKLRVAA